MNSSRLALLLATLTAALATLDYLDTGAARVIVAPGPVVATGRAAFPNSLLPVPKPALGTQPRQLTNVPPTEDKEEDEVEPELFNAFHVTILPAAAVAKKPADAIRYD